MEPGVFMLNTKRLQSTLDLAAAQATGADVHVTNGAADGHANTLSVRQPNAVALAVGVADVVAAHSALLANFTNLSHNHTSFWCVNSHNTVILAPEPQFDKCFFNFVLNKMKKTVFKSMKKDEIADYPGDFFKESL